MKGEERQRDVEGQAPAGHQPAPEEDGRQQKLKVEPQMDQDIVKNFFARASTPSPPNVSWEWHSANPAACKTACSDSGVKRPCNRENGRHKVTENRCRGSRLTASTPATVAARALGSIRTS